MGYNRKAPVNYRLAGAVFALISLLLTPALAGEVSLSAYYSGLLVKEPAIKSALIRNGEELGKAKEALGISGPLPPVDFVKDALIVVVSDDGEGGVLKIRSAESAAGGVIEVRYGVEAAGPVEAAAAQPSYPYLIAKLSPAPQAVRFVDEGDVSALASGTGLGQFRDYTNVLSENGDLAAAEFIPLDKGNSWTYKAETYKGKSEITNSVVSVADGWSVFDTFFGVSGVGMKISPGGDIFIASGGEIETFYSPDVVTEFPGTGAETPAGKFGEVMVVSMPEGGAFWFRDVYAKGVGLISHEQKSGKGSASYTLVRARVGAVEYPKGGKSEAKEKN